MKTLLSMFALSLGLGVAAFWALPAQGQAQPDASKKTEKPAEKSGDKDGEKLQKEVEDALKELEKLTPQAPQPGPPRAGGGGRNIDPNQLRMMLRIVPGGGLRAGGGGAAEPTGGRFGIAFRAPTPTIAAQLMLPEGTGQIIAAIRTDSPADKAGLQKSDILLEVNGKPVSNNQAQFSQDIREIKAGVEFNAVVLRKGQKETIKGIVLPEVAAVPQAPKLDDPLGQMDQLPPQLQQQLEQLQKQMNNRALMLPGLGGLGGLPGIGGLPGGGGINPQAAPRQPAPPREAPPAAPPQKKKVPEIF